MTTATAPVIELSVRVPCSAEYVSVVRLAVLSLCGRVPISYDEVEDLRLAVGEACATSVERAGAAAEGSYSINVQAQVSESTIRLSITDDVPLPATEPGAAEAALGVDEVPAFEDEGFRVSLMQLLVDEVEVQEAPGGGQTVTLVKLCGPVHEPEG